MKAGELEIGQRFQIMSKDGNKLRRKVFTKTHNYGHSCHLVTDAVGNVQHDEREGKNGNKYLEPRTIPHITVRTSSGRKFDMPKDKEVFPV